MSPEDFAALLTDSPMLAGMVWSIGYGFSWMAVILSVHLFVRFSSHWFKRPD